MKLYYTPGACSMNPHIVLREAGLKFDLEKVELSTHKTEKGTDFYSINPKGYVPALQLDNGQILTENPAIVQYIADQKPDAKLAPANGTLERYRLQEWLGFIGTEIHKTFSPLWNPKIGDAEKASIHEKIGKRFDYVAKELGNKQYLMGDQFTLADSYLFVILTWTAHVKFDLSKWPTLKAFHDRVAARPAVQATLEAEFGKR
jgi:glutathione S-transferase